MMYSKHVFLPKRFVKLIEAESKRLEADNFSEGLRSCLDELLRLRAVETNHVVPANVKAKEATA